MTTNVVFTRYLYNDDEVVLTFIESLLSKKELTECYFWISEYYKSGLKLRRGICCGKYITIFTL